MMFKKSVNVEKAKSDIFKQIVIVLILMLPAAINAQHFEYDEISDPALRTTMESMRAHQVQYTMYLFYTINVDTPGFLETGGYNIREKETGRIKMIPFTRWRAGPIVETGRNLDVYIDANSRGFLTVLMPTGIGYTRDGRLRLDSSDRLVTAQGSFPILNTNGGFIFANQSADITMSRNGTIFVDAEPAGKMDIAVFSNRGLNNLVTLNGSYFVSSSPEVPEKLPGGDTNYAIKQGHLEQNNVLKSIIGDVGMLKKSYEGTAKAAKAVSRVMQSVVSSVASP